MALEGLNPDLILALPNLHELDDEDKREALDILDRLQELQSYKNARLNFMDFVHMVWPSFIEGSHHKIMGGAFEDVILGND